MHVKSIVIRRDGYFSYNKADPSKPFLATIEVEGASGKVELNLTAEMSAKIVSIIAEEVAAAGRATAEMMTASCMNVAASKPVKALA